MHRLRSIRCHLFALSVAVLQLFVPLVAYAHMSVDGSMVREVCSASSTQRSAPRTRGVDGAGSREQGGMGAHCQSCCPCGGPALMTAGRLAGLDLPEPAGLCLPVALVGSERGSIALVPPATGPPRVA